MVVIKSSEGYFMANDTNGAFDVPVENYREDEEDNILNFE